MNRNSPHFKYACQNYASFIFGQAEPYRDKEALWDALPDATKAAIEEFVSTPHQGPARIVPRVQLFGMIERLKSLLSSAVELGVFGADQEEEAFLTIAEARRLIEPDDVKLRTESAATEGVSVAATASKNP